MTEIMFRTPMPADAAAITDIHAQGLATGHASFREGPYDWDSFFESFGKGHGLARIIEDRDGIAGWAGVSPTSAREVYRGIGEVSIYLSADRQGRGIGRHLLSMLADESERAGYWTLVAQIFPENFASLSLHESVGFRAVGKRERLGLMSYGPFANRWRDVILMERRSRLVG